MMIMRLMAAVHYKEMIMLTVQEVQARYSELVTQAAELDRQRKQLDREFQKLKYDCPHQHHLRGQDDDGVWRSCKDCHARLWPAEFAKYE